MPFCGPFIAKSLETKKIAISFFWGQACGHSRACEQDKRSFRAGTAEHHLEDPFYCDLVNFFYSFLLSSTFDQSANNSATVHHTGQFSCKSTQWKLGAEVQWTTPSDKGPHPSGILSDKEGKICDLEDTLNAPSVYSKLKTEIKMGTNGRVQGRILDSRKVSMKLIAQCFVKFLKEKIIRFYLDPRATPSLPEARIPLQRFLHNTTWTSDRILCSTAPYFSKRQNKVNLTIVTCSQVLTSTFQNLKVYTTNILCAGPWLIEPSKAPSDGSIPTKVPNSAATVSPRAYH